MNSSKKNIFAICGSTRKNSSNWRILEAISKLFDDRLNIEIYNQLDQLPHFNPSTSNQDISQVVKDLLEKIKNADGIIICTPEYVFSLPGVLKNALEWTVSETIFSYKPTAFIVASGLGEKTFESLDLIMKTLIQVEVPKASKLLVQGSREKVTDTGEISDKETLRAIKNVVDSLISTIEKKTLTINEN